MPCSHARRFPKTQDFRKRGPDPPTHRPTVGRAKRPSHGTDASSSLCKPLGSFHVLCILLAILYPVWEFQEHL